MSAAPPLAGIRVIDFGQLTAGANTAAMLGDLGADVLKIESPANLDLFRVIGALDQQAGWWNRSPPFIFSNRNKRSVAIDLKSAEGRALITDLIGQADVVVENFRRGVLERLGLHEAALRARFPRIILASISSQGETGPNRLHASFGSTLDATGGLSALTGYSGESPRVSGGDVNYPDQVVSLISTGLILAALRQVRETGRGVRLDISQREIVSFMVGEEIVAAGADPTRRGVRQGNAEDGLLLQDCWRCADGRWVAVTVTDAAQGAALARVLGVAVAARQNVAQPTNSLRTALSDWCQTRTADDAASTLAAAGLSAAPVLDGLDLLHAPHLTGTSIAEDATGRMVKGMPYRFDHLPFCVHRQAPDLGADTDTVLREVLGLNDAAIARLAALGVTRTEP
jgi:benzylsuccinate CoA-transferase BbsF subunit